MASVETSDDSLMSVLELTKKPLLSIPHRYVRTDHKNDKEFSIISFPKIPTIDFQNLSSDLDLEKLHSTCKDWGIFQLVNHGVSSSLLEKLRSETEEFFALPMEAKRKYRIRQGDVEGYGTVNKTSDQKFDWSDRMYMLTNPILRRKPHLLPRLPSSLRTTLESYFMEMERLAMKILLLLTKALKVGKAEETVTELFDDGMRSVRMTYYPPCPQPELVVGLTPHSDATAITILNQLNGVDGLEIKRDGVWIPVSVSKEAFVVNVGDVLEIMSNGVYKSVEHRAMANATKERISVAMFFHPKFKAEIGTLECLISPQNPPLFKRIGMENYVSDFFARRKIDGKTFLEQMKIENGDMN